MVNTGKRSRACQSCKVRRKKCDETFPYCTRCTNAGRECPGVPKEGDWIFRNETETVASRTTNPSIKRHTSTPFPSRPDSSQNKFLRDVEFDKVETVSSRSPPFLKLTGDCDATGIPPLLVPSKAEIALNYYVTNVARSSDGQFNLIPVIQNVYRLLPSRSRNSPMYRIITATGLVCMGNFPELRHLKTEAMQEYKAALSVVRNEIKDPAKLRSGEVLIFMVLLNLLEMTEETFATSENYHSHNRAALALLRLRGREQFRNPHKLPLYRSIMAYAIPNCIRTSTSLEAFENDPFWIGEPDAYLDPLDELSILIMKLASLRVRSENLTKLPRTEETEVLAASLVASASQVDGNLIQWFLNLPEQYQYTTTRISDEDAADLHNDFHNNLWGDTIHEYQDLMVAHLINRYRSMRLYAQEVIQKCIPHLPSKSPNTATTAATSTVVTQEMVDEICASLPYQLNMIIGSAAKWGAPAKKGTAGMYHLLVPLGTAMKAQGISDPQRKWLEKRMHFFCTTHGYSPTGVLPR